jgi:hypothetical protein
MVLLLQLIEIHKDIDITVKLVLHVSDRLFLIILHELLAEDIVVEPDFLVGLFHTF